VGGGGSELGGKVGGGGGGGVRRMIEGGIEGREVKEMGVGER